MMNITNMQKFTEWNPDKIDELHELLYSNKPIPPLDTKNDKPRELNREELLDILEIEYPEVYSDILKRIRKRDLEIAQFEMYSKLITDHNYNLHHQMTKEIERIENTKL